ncbi:MAG: hypothetical protein K5677_11415 [Ruminococcus sp.]|nr:hypothetical protein [Ruminococcus sp.]
MEQILTRRMYTPSEAPLCRQPVTKKLVLCQQWFCLKTHHTAVMGY